jgi:hypothetical protein
MIADVPDNAMFSAFPGGRDCYLTWIPWNDATNTWTDVPTRRPWMGVRVSSFDNGRREPGGNGNGGGTNIFLVED